MRNENGEHQPQHTLETFIILGAALIASLAAAHFNVFERFCEWARLHERFQIDELLPTSIIFLSAFFCLFLRRDSDLRQHLTSTEAARVLAVEAAKRDELTGLSNRRGFVEHAATIKATGTKVSVLIIDLDGFKAVNDTWGHAAGDEVLRHLALRFQAFIERIPGTYIARLGGDEFAVLVAASSCSQSAEDVAEGLVASAAAPLHSWADSPLSASIGLADDADDAPLHVIMQRADLAMYLAKQAGGGCYKRA